MDVRLSVRKMESMNALVPNKSIKNSITFQFQKQPEDTIQTVGQKLLRLRHFATKEHRNEKVTRYIRLLHSDLWEYGEDCTGSVCFHFISLSSEE